MAAEIPAPRQVGGRALVRFNEAAANGRGNFAAAGQPPGGGQTLQ